MLEALIVQPHVLHRVLDRTLVPGLRVGSGKRIAMPPGSGQDNRPTLCARGRTLPALSAALPAMIPQRRSPFRGSQEGFLPARRTRLAYARSTGPIAMQPFVIGLGDIAQSTYNARPTNAWCR